MTGFVVPKCECGHTPGDHLGARTTFPHPSIPGRCMVPGCGCKRWREAEQKAAA